MLAAALAAAGAVIVAVAVVVFLRAFAPRPAPELVLPRAVPAAGGATTAPGSSPPASAGGTVTVHAAGAVNRPGLYVLPATARVADAVTAAGGPAGDADLDRVNLATKVADGDRIFVPRKGEIAPPDPISPAVNAGGGTTKASAPAQPVDLNTADEGQLEALPGVGPATARAILTHRARNGRFRSVDELLDVPGIGPAKLETLRPLVRI